MPDSGEFRPHPLHRSALLKDDPTPEPLHEMARSVWALGYEVPAEVHQDVLDKWEAVLALFGSLKP